MKGWLVAVASVAVLATIIELLLPDGKIKKYISGTTKAILVLSILIPILQTVSSDTDIDIFSSLIEETALSETVTVDAESLKLRSAEQAIGTALCDEGIDCTVSIDENLIKITLRASINDKDGNIYTNSKTVIETVRRFVDVMPDQITVYGKDSTDTMVQQNQKTG